MGVQRLGRNLLTLLEHKLIQVGKDGGVEADAVFHQKDKLHPHLIHVMFQIHLILHQLDDGDQQVGVSQPAEHVFERAEVFVDDALRDAVAERRQNHDRNVVVFRLDMPSDIETVVVSRTRHTYYKVERHLFQQFPRLFLRRYLREAGRIAERQGSVFVEYLLRSEEHTSELQSRQYLVCRLLLEKKK